MSKTSHILCMSAGHGEGAYAPVTGFAQIKGDLHTSLNADLWFGPRPRLEVLTPVKSGNTVADMIDWIVNLAGTGASSTEIVSQTVQHLPNVAEGIWNDKKAAYPSFLQIIPYFLLRHDNKYITYFRPSAGGENRLHGKISIGVGGHVDLEDAAIHKDGSIDLAATLNTSACREAKEEMGVDIEKPFTWIATIYAIDTEVDQVHLGVVGVVDLTDKQHSALEANHEIGDHSFKTLADVAAMADADHVLETWTRLIIESNPLA